MYIDALRFFGFEKCEDTMKKIIAVLISLTFVCISFAQSTIIASEAYASYYGDEFNGRQTASGEVYDPNAFTAAHRSLPFSSIVEVVNLDNGASVFVKINDRGPFVANREIDLSKVAANAIGMLQQGIARVSIKLISTPTPQVITQDSNQYTVAQSDKQFNAPQQNDRALAHNSQSYNQFQQAGQPANIYTPAEKKEGLVLWRIQLASFTREENALRLVEALRKIGFEPAYERADKNVRVVLYGIRDEDLEKVKNVLAMNDFKDYIIRQESW